MAAPQPLRRRGRVQDVVTHLISTNRFWALSIGQALARRAHPVPGRLRSRGVARPARRQGAGHAAGGDPRAAFRASNAEMLDAIEALDDAGWERLGGGAAGPRARSAWSPTTPSGTAGCTSATSCCPLGRPPVEDDGEVLTCLRYAAALGQAFEVGRRRGPAGTAVLEVTDPDARSWCRRPTPTRSASTTAPRPPDAPRGRLATRSPLLEMLSRATPAQPVPDAVAWLAAGLAVVFDQAEPVVSRASARRRGRGRRRGASAASL